MSDVLEGDLEQRKYSQLDYKYRGGGLAVWFHPSPSTRLTILKSLLPSQKPTSLSSNIKRNFFFVFPDTEEFIQFHPGYKGTSFLLSQIHRNFFLVIPNTERLLTCHPRYTIWTSSLSFKIHLNFCMSSQIIRNLFIVTSDTQEIIHCQSQIHRNFFLVIPDKQALLYCYPRYTGTTFLTFDVPRNFFLVISDNDDDGDYENFFNLMHS